MIYAWYALYAAFALYILADMFSFNNPSDQEMILVTFLTMLASIALFRCKRCGFPITFDHVGTKARGSVGFIFPKYPNGQCRRCGCEYRERGCGGVTDWRDK